jgi:cell division septation protein DedD
MVQGAGRPGQPSTGQRSIFGGGGPTFAQMPTYTPVTRAPEPQAAQQQQPSYPPQTANQPAQPQAAPQQAAPQQLAPQATPPQAPAASSFQQPQPQPQPQAYRNQQYQPQAFTPAEPGGQQAYPAPGYGNGAQGAPIQPMPDRSDADPGFPEAIFPDFNASSPGLSDSFSGQSAGGQSFPDASFPEEVGDASFPETSFSTDFGHDESGMDAGFAAAPAGGEPHFEPLNEGASPDFHMPQPQMPQQAYHPQAPQPQMPQSDVVPSDPGRQLQAFDAGYDRPPEISLGGPQAPGPAQAPQDFYEGERPDADFLDESQVAPAAAKRSKMATLKGRSAFMVASALLGAIALGGAIAYAYKLSGGGLDGDTPIIQADATPVKEAPDQPGGKEFPHKNKLIYDRLTNGDEPESERIVPRQEDVAVPAMPPASETAGLPAPVASSDLGTTQSVGDDGGPRKVKTLVVRPDGSVETPPAAEATAAAGEAAGAAAENAEGAIMPVPAAQAQAQAAAPAEPPKVAAADPKPAPKPAPAADKKYVVQVGAHKSQAEALANYADIQQKNPNLLGKYPPLVQKVGVSGGTLYRLRVGPTASKNEAYKLCGDLKKQGTDCFVAVQ